MLLQNNALERDLHLASHGFPRDNNSSRQQIPLPSEFCKRLWLIRLAAKPIDSVISYAARLARKRNREASDDKLLARDDEVGQLARLFLYFSMVKDIDKAKDTPPGGHA